MIDHLDIPSTSVHRESAEAQDQDPASASSQTRLTKKVGAVPQESKKTEEVAEEDEDQERRRSARRDSDGSDESEVVEQRRKNQFSFLERATQTRTRPVKVNIPSLAVVFY